VGAVAVVVLVGATVRALWAAEAARQSWSSTTGVVVATRDLAVGSTVDAGDLRVVGLPEAVVPPGAASDDPAELVGATVTDRILAGEAVAPARLSPAGLGPTAALLRPGWRAVAVPLPVAAPPLAPGDRVELVAVAGGPGSGAPATVVTEFAEVLDIDGDTLTVAVPGAVATDVVGAVAQGFVAPVLVGAGAGD